MTIPRVIVPPAPPPLTIAERPFQLLVTDLARFCGWLTYHTHDSRRSERGFPDLVLVRLVEPYAVVFAELKTEAGKVKPEQRAWGEALVTAGARYYLWRPSDWDSIVATLTEV